MSIRALGRVDLNADLGEGYPNDAALLERVTSASVACGGHAGDLETMVETLSAARERGVVVGAHPGYPDREGFGRREQSSSTEQVEQMILDQFETLERQAKPCGVSLRYVKPHGALYNQAQVEAAIAKGVIAATVRLKLPVLGQPGSVLESLANRAGLRFVSEGFPDRRYTNEGRLVPRSEPDAVLTERAEVESQILRLIQQGVETFCIHGDDPRAIANADTVRQVLLRERLVLGSFV